MLTSYSPGVKGIYSTLQLPSLLSLQDILASDGPSMANPRPPVPAPLKERKIQTSIKYFHSKTIYIVHGSSNPVLEGHWPEEYSFNPNKAHLNKTVKVFKVTEKFQVSEFDHGWAKLCRTVALQGWIWGTLI